MNLRLLVCAAAVTSVLSGCALQNMGAPVYDRTGSSGIGSTGVVSMTGETYVVQPGDTLYSIAVRHGCNPTELAKANNISDPTQVSVGTVLNITAARTQAVQTLAPQGTAPVTDVTIAGQDDNSLTPTGSQSVTTQGEVTIAQSIAPATNAQLPLGHTKLSWPVAKNTILTNFSDEGSKGIEIAGKMGDDVKAAAEGRVIYVDDKVVGYGKLIIIKHGASEMTVYGHNSEILVQRGQEVKAGEVIAKMGDSDSKTVNLLFEVRVKDKPVDPLQYLPK